MKRTNSLLRVPFVSALLGGLIVVAFGWTAISAGWIKADGPGGSGSVATVGSPVVDHSDSSNTINQIYKQDGQGVAFISAERTASAGSQLSPFGGGGSGGGTATGSGFVIDTDGHILTNNHVVSGSDSITVKLGDSDTSYDATVVGTDAATDLALLKIDAPSDALHPLALGSSSDLQVGDPVVAIGNPFGLDRTVTSGIVSALQRQIQAPNGFAISNVIQTDAPINPGNSGGPLINSNGEVIGINSQIETGGSGNGNVGIGFAVPIDTAKKVVDQLKTSGTVTHAFLGITGASIDSTLAGAVNLPVDTGVLIQEVSKGSPADRAGLRGATSSDTIDGIQIGLGGDVISKVNGTEIGSMDDVVAIVNDADPGDQLDLTVLRGGAAKDIQVTLADRPASVSATQRQEPPSNG